MLLKALRQQVLEAGLNMQKDGVARGAQGNISARDPQSGLVVITPTAIPYERLKPGDLCVLDPQRRQVEGPWRPTSELALHMVFYARRADVHAVVHSHAPYSTVFGILLEPLPMALTEAAMLIGGAVPVAAYRRPGSEEVAEVTCAAAGEAGTAVILANHGLVTVGGDLARAYETTLAVENTARLVIMARSTGGRESALSAEEAAAVRKIYLEKYKPGKA